MNDQNLSRSKIFDKNSKNGNSTGQQQPALWTQSPGKINQKNEPFVELENIDEMSSQIGQSALLDESLRDSVSNSDISVNNEPLNPIQK